MCPYFYREIVLAHWGLKYKGLTLGPVSSSPEVLFPQLLDQVARDPCGGRTWESAW